MLGIVFFLLAVSAADPIDPRYHFDARCPRAVLLDPLGQQRDPSSSSTYLYNAMQAGSTIEDCATSCCHDWSCISFAFYSAFSKNPGSGCVAGMPCCAFKDDVDALVRVAGIARFGTCAFIIQHAAGSFFLAGRSADWRPRKASIVQPTVAAVNSDQRNGGPQHDYRDQRR
jgi:hypothetical protein